MTVEIIRDPHRDENFIVVQTLHEGSVDLDGELGVCRIEGRDPTIDLRLEFEGYTGSEHTIMEMTPEEARALAAALVELASKAEPPKPYKSPMSLAAEEMCAEEDAACLKLLEEAAEEEA